MTTFIFFSLFIIFYIACAILMFSACYRYDFFEVRTDYIRQKKYNKENDDMFLIIVFWPALLVIILFYYLPQRIIEFLVENINKDLELNNKLNKHKNLDNTDIGL